MASITYPSPEYIGKLHFEEPKGLSIYHTQRKEHEEKIERLMRYSLGVIK
jgi:hypothetical protein